MAMATVPVIMATRATRKTTTWIVERRGGKERDLRINSGAIIESNNGWPIWRQ
jgi:hypothetical protein